MADSAKKKYLVFTSAGESANLHHWLRGERNFDLWVTYFGEEPGKYQGVADYYNARKGGKFPNFYHAYKTWPDKFDGYEAIMLMDDDIIIAGGKISQLFELRKKYDLWCLQPAMDRRGKVSHPINRRDPSCRMRFTNFIEIGCPLFRKDKLDDFMAVYDGALVGWGIDYWYLDVLGPDLNGRMAVVDDIPCINPPDSAKLGGLREIDQLQPVEQRKADWERIRAQYGIKSGGDDGYQMINYRCIRKPYWLGVLSLAKEWVVRQVGRQAWKIKAKFRNR